MWRIGNKVPINVYEDDRPVCQCHTALDAKAIVDAVNDAKWRDGHDAKIRRAQEEYAEKHSEAHRQQILLLMGDKDKLKEQLRIARREAKQEAYLRCADASRLPTSYAFMFRSWANEADGGGKQRPQ
jgi:hypothetical protein